MSFKSLKSARTLTRHIGSAALAAAICVASASSSAFAEAKEVTLKTTYSGSAITDGFQALVKLSASNDAYGFLYNEAGGASHNIWFTSEDGNTVYPHEIDKWDTSSDSFVWVRLPELKKGTTFKMHWSDSSGDVLSASGNVWDGYVGVWHMNETGTTTAPDSTANGIGAAPVNNSGASTSIGTATGKVGAGRAVTQGTMLKVTDHASSGRISDAKVFTIGGWVNRTATGSYPRIFCGNVDNGRTQWELFATADNDMSVRGGSTEFSGCAVNNGTSSGWHYLTVVYNGTTATLYDNGTSAKSGNIGNAAQGGFFTIGGWTGRNDRSFAGTFDEVRMYNGALSAARIAADYATMNDPTAFLTLAPPPPSADAVDYFVEWVQPSSPNLYVDTGVQGKVGVKAELQFIHRDNGSYPVLLGSWGGNNKRFNLVMHWGEQGRWEYGNQMNNLGGFPWYGALTTVNVEVPANGAMSCTWKNTEGGTMNHTMNATGTYGLLDTAATLYLFASHYKDASSDQANQNHRGRLYYCKLWEGDTGAWTLARNFRPCVKDGVAGLYDYVTGEVHYPVSSVANCVLVAGPVAYDRIATWNGGATPTAAELGTAANWSCTDKSGASVASEVPDKATLVVFPSGIGSVTLPDGYTAPWGAVKAEGSVAHPATQYGTHAQSRSNVAVPAYEYTALGDGSLADLINANNNNSARKVSFGNLQMRHDGWFYVNAAQAGTWAMTLYVDDYYAFFIDDVEVLSYHTYSGGVAGTAEYEVSEGWHRFISIIGDTGGGWGTSTTFGNDKVPFTFAVNGTTYSLTDDTTFPKGSGTSTITLTADANWSALGKVALQGGATIDLNGHSLVVDDILADDYIGTVITNSVAKKSVLYFLGDPLESKAYATGIIKEANEKIILAHDGDQVATWTGAANDGDPATAGNWEDIAGGSVVPTDAYAVKIAGSNVNLQIPAGSTFVCKSFEIGNCTFTADCDWRGLSVKPAITGTADLNGHNLNIKRLSASSGSEFANSVAGTVSEVRFDVESGADVFGEEWYIENAANLKTAENARIVLVKGASDISANVLKIGDASGIYADFVQTDGAVTMGNSAESRIGGWSSGNKGHGTYTMYGGSLTVGSSLHVGGYGTGEFTQHGGTVTLNSFFAVGRFGGSTGTYVITNGTLTVKNETEIGMDGGTGRFDICGDARVNLKSLVMPIERGNANLHISDNASLTMTGLTIGRGYGTSDTKGYFTQDGGTVEIGGDATIGRTGIGHYTMTGGRLHATGNFYVGHSWSGNNGGDGLFSISGDAVAELDKGIILGNNKTPGKLSLSGGTLFTPSIKKGSNTATVTFDGGTIVATNVTDGANFISGLNNVAYGPSGLTLDTAGYNVTMAAASGANVTATAGSTFTKTGSGTLTVAAVPPVGNMVVSNGTLALSASCDNTAPVGIAHRWSFNGEGNDYTDSITGASASTFGNDATKRATTGGKLVLRGNGSGQGSLNLGKNLLGSGDATVEIWASNDAAKHYARVFDYGNGSYASNPGQTDCFLFIWSTGTDVTKDIVQLKQNNTAVVNKSGTMSVMELGKQYYFAFTFKANGDGSTTVKWMRRNAVTGELERSDEATVSDWTLANLVDKNSDFWLGVSKYSGDSDANASYDEVRIWNGALSADALALSAQKGPDATSADLAEISGCTLTLETGATLSIGTGNTLTQPVVTGGGMVSGGTLVVSDKILVKCGETLTASGTIDLTNAKVELVDPENLTTGFYFIKAAPSATLSILGKPEATNLPTGWQISVSSSGAKIQKVGFSIFLR